MPEDVARELVSVLSKAEPRCKPRLGWMSIDHIGFCVICDSPKGPPLVFAGVSFRTYVVRVVQDWAPKVDFGGEA